VTDLKRHPEARAQLGAELGIRVCRPDADVVVDVSGTDLATRLRSGVAQQQEQGHGVGATGQGEENGPAEKVGELNPETGDKTGKKVGNGAGEWNRTTDTGLMRPLLCP
jgi:hypothetical protein